MVSVKELKSVDLASFTIISTGIAVLFSIISAILLTVAIGITSPSAIGASIYLISTIIIGTLMYNIYNSFFEGFLYNTLAKKMNTIKLAFKDEKEIVKISTTETAIIISMIITIQTILIYLVSVVLLPLLLGSVVQTLMYSGQSMLAYSIYQFMMLLSQPMTIAMIIFGTFIISFVFILLGSYIYNVLANTGREVVVNLSKEGNLTAIDSVDVLKFAIVFAVISCVLNLILGIVTLISGGNFAAIAVGAIGGLVAGFVEGALFAVFYNFLAPKLGKLKLELIEL